VPVPVGAGNAKMRRDMWRVQSARGGSLQLNSTPQQRTNLLSRGCHPTVINLALAAELRSRRKVPMIFRRLNVFHESSSGRATANPCKTLTYRPWSRQTGCQSKRGATKCQ
jgi:hypothetical protein